MHTGCPVVKGVKWTAIKWIHSKPFRPELYDATPVGTLADAYNPNGEDGFNPSLCTDVHPQCKAWAGSGECKVGGHAPAAAAARGGCQLPLAPHDCALLVLRRPAADARRPDAPAAQANSKSMTGDQFSGGACRKSCGVCTPCAEGDVMCLEKNRRAAGYLIVNPLEME